MWRYAALKEIMKVQLILGYVAILSFACSVAAAQIQSGALPQSSTPSLTGMSLEDAQQELSVVKQSVQDVTVAKSLLSERITELEEQRNRRIVRGFDFGETQVNDLL